MVNYEYFKKLKQIGIYPWPLLIDFLSNCIDLLPVQNGNIGEGQNSEYLLSKVNFPAKSAI